MTNKIKLMPPDQHWYWSEKKQTYYPSVTAITAYLPKGKFFERYLADQDSFEESQRFLKEAGERGTRIHEATELLDRGESLVYGSTALTDEEYALIAHGYINWHTKYQPQMEQIELSMVSDKHKLGGTLDRIAMIDGERTLVDIKSSRSAIWDSPWIQVACYADMFETLHPTQQIDAVAILRLTEKRKDGYEYVIRDRDEWKEDYKQFKRTYDTMIYLSDGKVTQQKIIEVPEV